MLAVQPIRSAGTRTRPGQSGGRGRGPAHLSRAPSRPGWRRATAAYVDSKEQLNYAAGHGLSETLDKEAEVQTALGRTADHRAATLAFTRKEAPSFLGQATGLARPPGQRAWSTADRSRPRCPVPRRRRQSARRHRRGRRRPAIHGDERGGVQDIPPGCGTRRSGRGGWRDRHARGRRRRGQYGRSRARRASAPGSRRPARNRAGDHGAGSRALLAGRGGRTRPPCRGLPGPEPGPVRLAAQRPWDRPSITRSLCCSPRQPARARLRSAGASSLQRGAGRRRSWRTSSCSPPTRRR